MRKLMVYVVTVALMVIMCSCSKETTKIQEENEFSQGLDKQHELVSEDGESIVSKDAEESGDETSQSESSESYDDGDVKAFVNDIIGGMCSKDKNSVIDMIAGENQNEIADELIGYSDCWNSDDEYSISSLYNDDEVIIVRVSNLNKAAENEDVYIDLPITWDDNHLKIDVEFLNIHTCANCDQNGMILTGGVTCPSCNGSGSLTNTYYDAVLGWQNQPIGCGACGCSGQIGQTYSVCPECGGTHYR